MVYSGADQRKYRSPASLAFVRGIHRLPMNSPHKRSVTPKMFPFHDVIMPPTYRPRRRGSRRTEFFIVVKLIIVVKVITQLPNRCNITMYILQWRRTIGNDYHACLYQAHDDAMISLGNSPGLNWICWLLAITRLSVHYNDDIMSAMSYQNHQPHASLPNGLFRRRSKKLS